MSRCQSTVNQFSTASAITEPTPSTAASSSGEAARMASSDPKWVASERAAVGPTWRIDRATSTRHRGWLLTLSRFDSSFWPTVDSTRPSRIGTLAPASSAGLAVRV